GFIAGRLPPHRMGAHARSTPIPGVGLSYPVQPMGERPVAIEVRDLHKGFRIPRHETRTVRERLAHPLRNRGYRELKVLRGLSFDIHQGEFFGVVGRNGSGKSTLLKLISSIYRADSGRIRVA